MTEHSKQVREEIKAAVEEAYLKLAFASNAMDVIDYVDAIKIAKVRKQVLALLQEM